MGRNIREERRDSVLTSYIILTRGNRRHKAYLCQGAKEGKIILKRVF